MEALGRREAHKAASRKALQDAARRMFQERGYEETTVRDIAAAAGVTERTFFRYFPSKEDLILGELVDLIPVMKSLVAARPLNESPYTATLNAVITLAAEAKPGVIFSGPPEWFAWQPIRQFRPVLGRFEDGLAQALRDRLTRQDPATATELRATELRAAVLARAGVGAVRAALQAFAALPEEQRTLAVGYDLLHAAFAHLTDG